MQTANLNPVTDKELVTSKKLEVQFMPSGSQFTIIADPENSGFPVLQVYGQTVGKIKKFTRYTITISWTYGIKEVETKTAREDMLLISAEYQ